MQFIIPNEAIMVYGYCKNVFVHHCKYSWTNTAEYLYNCLYQWIYINK